MDCKDKWVLLTKGRVAKLRSYKKGIGFWAKPIVGFNSKCQGYVDEGDIIEEMNQEIAELLYG